jgi:hypothetical protein
MKNHYRLMLGRKSSFADEAHKGNFVGVDYDIDRDLTGDLFETWRDFNRKFIAIYLERTPGKTEVAAGLACGALWTVAKAFQAGRGAMPRRNEHLPGREVAGQMRRRLSPRPWSTATGRPTTSSSRMHRAPNEVHQRPRLWWRVLYETVLASLAALIGTARSPSVRCTVDHG